MLELGIVGLGGIDGLAAEDRVEAHEAIAVVGVVFGLFGFFCVVVEGIVHDAGYTLGAEQFSFASDGLYLLVLDAVTHLHGGDIVDTEGQDILVTDGGHDGVGM